MEALVLQVDDYNPDVKSTPRNPITVNDVSEVFQCQPGRCAYDAGNFPFSHPEYNDNYLLCGIQALVNSPIDFASFIDSGFSSQPDELGADSFQTCSIDSSSQFMEQINDAGVETIAVNVAAVEDVSAFMLANRRCAIDGGLIFASSFLKIRAIGTDLPSSF